MRSAEEFDAAQRLIAAGVNDCAIARQLGIPRTTVRDWRRRPQFGRGSMAHRRAASSMTSPRCRLPHTATCSACISAMVRSRGPPRVANPDHARPEVPGDHRTLLPGHRDADAGPTSGHRATQVGCVDVSLYSKHWPCLLPQHGPGKKHTTADRARTLAAGARRPGHRRVRPRPDPQRRLPRRRQRPRGRAASATTSRTVPKTSSGCSPPHSTSSASTGRGRPSTSCPSTERPIRPVWTSSSARRPARYR